VLRHRADFHQTLVAHHADGEADIRRILVWLGVVASGLGYFMWNYGATQVDAGTLGIMNNGPGFPTAGRWSATSADCPA
jgi:drug/metabolite transporter (DMT)-like permease